MVWQYVLVFIGALIVDISPIPLPPAFTVMIFLQIKFDLNIWWVIFIGVAGSVLGRYILTLYISKLSSKIFKTKKNEEVEFLGKKFKKRGYKGQLFILLYSLLPLPTTPLFIAGGMAKLKPFYIIIPFIIGKFTSDMAAVFLGKYAAENTGSLFSGMISWKSISGLAAGLILVCLFIFIDWTSLLIRKKLRFRFKIFK